MKQKGIQSDVLQKMQRYCAYRERCHSEVRYKLLTLGFTGSSLEEIISQLVEDGYLNEERYAKLFVQGKFRINKWGKNKIIQALLKKKVSEKCIQYGLNQINAEEYKETLKSILLKKYDSLNKEDRFSARNKMYRYGVNKGYQSSLVLEMIDSVL